MMKFRFFRRKNRKPKTALLYGRFNSNAGIAIGPILFVIATLGLIAAVLSSNIGTYGSAGVIDRLGADLPSQASLIRNKVTDCSIKLASALAITNHNLCISGGSCAGCQTTADCQSDPSTFVTTGTPAYDVSQLSCNGINLWAGSSYPVPTAGFAAWNYVSNTTGGRCIYTQPTITNPKNVPSLVEGLKLAMKKFSNQTTCDGVTTPCNSEGIYDPNSASQKYILWVGVPNSGAAPDPNCLP